VPVPAYLTQLLSDRPDLKSHSGPVRLKCQLIGELNFPSGRLVACDIMMSGDSLAFKQAVPPGRYPVFLSDITLSDGDEQTAAAWLRFSDATPVRWDFARWDSRKQVKEPAYIVDSGMGAFMSLEAAPLIDACGESLTDEVYAAMDKEPYPGWVILPVPGAEHLNFAVFSPGLGDGVYASYWGFDANDTPVCLLTDFDVLGLPDEAEPAVAKPWWRIW